MRTRALHLVRDALRISFAGHGHAVAAGWNAGGRGCTSLRRSRSTSRQRHVRRSAWEANQWRLNDSAFRVEKKLSAIALSSALPIDSCGSRSRGEGEGLRFLLDRPSSPDSLAFRLAMADASSRIHIKHTHPKIHYSFHAASLKKLFLQVVYSVDAVAAAESLLAVPSGWNR